MRNRIADPARAISARARGVAAGAATRLGALREERGAQAAEYAMLGGVSAAACGGLVVVFNTTDLLPGIVGTIMDTIGGFVSSWF